MKQKIKYIPFGIACRQKDIIFINKELIKHPALFAAIIEHERSHTSKYSWHDLLIDIRNNHLKGLKKEYYKFVIKNPSTWIEFLPFWVYDGHITINPLLLLLYGLMVSILGIVGWLL
jgi:hypothetical protein